MFAAEAGWSAVSYTHLDVYKRQARMRAANVLHAMQRPQQAFDALHAIQADAGLRDDDRRDGYLLEAELRLKDKDCLLYTSHAFLRRGVDGGAGCMLRATSNSAPCWRVLRLR